MPCEPKLEWLESTALESHRATISGFPGLDFPLEVPQLVTEATVAAERVLPAVAVFCQRSEMRQLLPLLLLPELAQLVPAERRPPLAGACGGGEAGDRALLEH